MKKEIFKGFDPIYNSDCEVLILGSFPSVKSRAYGFYYGNKQNRFWKMLEKVFDESISEDIEKKKAFLLKHHIALYDVICESDLIGSLDTTLNKSKKKIADISFLLPPSTKVKLIICNGKTAYNLLIKNFTSDIEIAYLPSTSPANVTFSYDKWIEKLKFLRR